MTIRTIDRRDRTEGELTLIRDQLRTIGTFRKLKPLISASGIEAFLLVAQKEGQTMGDYAKLAGLSPTTMSRHLLDVGERDRHFEAGLGLVESRDNIMNRRERLYYLTHKGRALLASLLPKVQR